MIDKIPLRDAMESDAWLMVFAAEPERNLEVQMTYHDLFVIRKMADAFGLKGVENEN